MATEAEEVWKVSKGATGKPLTATLTQGPEDARTPIDLTGCTVLFSMFRLNTRLAKVTLAACTVTSATDGRVSYAWAAGDVDTIGLYRGQFRIQLPSTAFIYVPTDIDDGTPFIPIEVVDIAP